jgi:hypothetical protein
MYAQKAFPTVLWIWCLHAFLLSKETLTIFIIYKGNVVLFLVPQDQGAI